MNYLGVPHFVSPQYLAPCSLDKGIYNSAYGVAGYSYKEKVKNLTFLLRLNCFVCPQMSVNSHQILEADIVPLWLLQNAACPHERPGNSTV